MAARGSKVGTLLRERGFTLVELLVTLVILAVVMITLMGVMFGASRSRTATTNQMESVQAVRAGLDLMTRDLRSAGYGADLDYAAQPQPPIAYVDSTQVLINANLQPYPDHVPSHTPPLAYDPLGSPRPRPLDGTSYAPPIKYHSGAELIRWTLDVNNDGQVDADDLAAPDGADAQHTPNPDDFVLVRQVYGDSIGNVAGANGGLTERVALVDKPGAGIPPMFTVHFKGVSAPWDWKNGPVPASMLSQISAVTVELTASSARRNADGTYARTTLRTQVTSNRNVPDTGGALYQIDGYVYNDKNLNHAKDAGEPGIANAYLMLGSAMSANTDATGHYAFHVEAGTYRLKQIAPNGYGITGPDSTFLSFGPDRTYSFADSAKSGGFVHVITYHDTDGDGYRDTGEPAEPGIKITATPGPDVQYTVGDGKATLFVPTGAFTITMTPPDSLFASTPNPVFGVMVNGDTAGVVFGLRKTAFGTISGKVFRDVNRNGQWDSGEDGITNVWVAASSDGGKTVAASATTDVNGDYTIQAPVNDPPRTAPYAVYITPPQGYFATGPTALAPVWVKENTLTGGKNFGALAFQMISLQAARVLSLANGDLVEHDWPLNQTTSRVRDLDLVLGSDANGSDQISVWFNRYDSSSLFSSSADYTRSAAASVLSLAVDTLDTGANLQRERADVVTGTTWSSAKNNFFVWLNQNSTGNEGFLPTSPTKGYASKDKGDVTAILTADLCGATSTPDGVDILIGTNSKANGQGSIELWQNTNAKTPDWNRVGLYPPDGSIANNSVGEVTSMALADLDGDGLKDLVVTSRTSSGSYSGQILFLKNMGRTSNPVFQYMSGQTLSEDVATAVAVTDMDADGHPDIVVGTQNGVATGQVQYWRNTTASIFDFTLTARLSAPGIVSSVVAADLGGDTRKDIAVGYRTSTSGFGGGVRIYYSDLGTLIGPGVDPTGGAVVNFVPTMTTGNFNYGMYPASPYPPFLDDLAVGVKVSDTTGALVLLIR
jgi:prepilin-type N-terminal cleavage/methylation domain-containing protein